MAALTIILIWLAIVLTATIGYVLNIMALLHHVGFGLLEVVRIIGLFVPPLGVFMGLFI